MYIGYNDEQEALRQELRAYYDKLLTPEVKAALHKGYGTGPDMRRVVRQMAADGWLGIGWPVEYVPGAAGLLAGKPVQSLLGVFSFGFALTSVYWRNGVVPDPLLAGASAPLFFLGIGSLALAGYAMAVAVSLPSRRDA